MKFETLNNYVNNNLSANEISNLTGKSLTTIRYWLKKYNLKTNFLSLRNKTKDNSLLYTNYNNKSTDESKIDLIIVQNYYNNNHSWKETCKHFNIPRSFIYNKIKQKKLISRSSSQTYFLRKHPIRKTSEKTKKKLSEIRTNYLINNPDKKSWQTSSNRNSIPCQFVKNLFKENNIQFTEEHEPLIHKNRFFSIDIAFPNKKFGIEINGRQHYNSDGSLKEYYQNRHDLIVQEGWTLIEVPYHKAFNKQYMLSLISDFLG